MNRLLTFCLLTLLISCDDNHLGSKSNPMDSKIIIETREVLESNARRLTLFCKTEEIYPCENFPILTERQTDENSIKINFKSIEETIVCLTGLGPATALIDLNSLPTGEYDIELNNANLKNSGVLKITDTDISLIFDIKNGIDFVRTNTKRVPDKTYWATIGYHVQSSSALVDEFIQKFEDVGAIFSEQSPGHYFYYEIDNSGDIVTNIENSGYQFMKKFIFQYNDDESKLKELVEVEGKNYKETLSMRLETYKGEMFYNWGN